MTWYENFWAKIGETENDTLHLHLNSRCRFHTRKTEIRLQIRKIGGFGLGTRFGKE